MNLKTIYIPQPRDKSVSVSQDAKGDINMKLGGTFQPHLQI